MRALRIAVAASSLGLAAIVLFHSLTLSYVVDVRTIALIGELAAHDSLGSAYTRSLVYSAIVALASVSVGFWLAACSSTLSPADRTAKLLILLLLPVTIGDLAIAATLRAVYSASPMLVTALGPRPPLLLWPLAVAIKVCTLGSMCWYVSWLTLSSTPRTVTHFARVGGLSFGELASDAMWPVVRPLIGVLLLLCFVLASQEHTVLDLVFKSSAGTSTELAGNALERLYYGNLNALAQPAANDLALQQGAAYLLLVLVSSPLVIWIGLAALSMQVRSARDRWKTAPGHKSTRIAVFVAALMVLLPMALGVALLQPEWNWEVWDVVLPALGASLVAGVAAAVVAVGVGAAWRIAFKSLADPLSVKGRLALHALLVLPAIPSLCVLLEAFGWVSRFAGSPMATWQVAWLLGQIAVAFPVLSVFLVWIHAAVPSAELQLHVRSGATFGEVISLSFLRRFMAEYALVAVFSVSLVWNEPSLARVLSDVVPSFSSLLTRRLSGRAVDYGEAGTLVLVSAIFAGTLLVLWSRVAAARLPEEGS